MFKLAIFLFLGLLVESPIPTLAAKPYKSLGCFKDDANRAIASLEGTNSILDGHYRNRANHIEKCYKVSLSLGYKVFAIQDGGQCFGSATAKDTYRNYGESTECANGKGGPMANTVYEIQEVCAYKKMGGTVSQTGRPTKTLHTNSSEECSAKCKDGCGSTVFCGFNSNIGTNCYLYAKKLTGSEELKPEVDGRCFSYYMKCTLAGAEAEDEKDDVSSAAQKKVSPYESLGCWKDDIPRALTSIDNAASQKHGHYKSRSHPLQDCLETAKTKKYKFFGLQDGGQCFGSNDATSNGYKKYGASTACVNGKGGPMANSVYGVTQDEVKPEEVTSAATETAPLVVATTVAPLVVATTVAPIVVATTVAPLVVATTVGTPGEGCCKKIRVESNGMAKNTHFWALGSFIRQTGSLQLLGVTYEQIKSQENSDQYFLTKTENGGWKIGRLWNGKVESLVYYDASDAKINCPSDKPSKPWMVRSGNKSAPDNTLKIQCEA